MATKQPPCHCHVLLQKYGKWFPHKRTFTCIMLAESWGGGKETQRDYEQEIAADNRERAADIRSELRNLWK